MAFLEMDNFSISLAKQKYTFFIIILKQNNNKECAHNYKCKQQLQCPEVWHPPSCFI